jgi:hypothetical protein
VRENPSPFHYINRVAIQPRTRQFFQPTSQVRTRDVIREFTRPKVNLQQFFAPKPNQVRARDLIRELPKAAHTLSRKSTGVPFDLASSNKFLQETFMQPLARGLGSIYLNVKKPKEFSELTPRTRFERKLFGEGQKVVPIEKYGSQETGLNIPEKYAPFVGAGLVGLDVLGVSPGGIGKGGVKQITKLSKADEIAKVLKKSTKIADEYIPTIAKKLTKVTDEVKIGKVIQFAEKYGVSPGEAKQIFKKTGKAVDFTKKVPSRTKPANVGSSFVAEEMKDISTTNKGFRDIYRNFKDAFGTQFNKARKMFLDPLNEAKANYTNETVRLTNELDEKIVKGLDIGKKSKESRAVQEFGEGLRDYDSIVGEFGQKRADDIVKADGWFRAKYNQLLDEVNAIRKEIYPNNPEKIIPKRKDYYRHFRDLSQGLEGLKNIFDSPANIESTLAGVSDFTKPRSKWLSFAQRRLGTETELDAVGGFLDYTRASTYAKYIDPQIPKLRGLQQELSLLTKEGVNKGKLNNLLEFLTDYTNDLAGKTNPIDRAAQKYIPGGRKAFRVLDWMNKRVKANVILGNLSSSLAQVFNLPQGMADAGYINSAQGFTDWVTSGLRKNAPIKKSSFMAERYLDDVFDKFDARLIDQPKKLAKWLIKAGDRVGSEIIWNAEYRKAVSQGIKNPVEYADDLTRKMVAGRGIGEVPLVQKSKLFQMFAPFQLEVTNLWHVFNDWGKQREFGRFVKFAIGAYLMNKGAEKIRGSGVVFDPIDAIADAITTYQEEESKGVGAIRAGGRLAGEVLSNVPGGQTAAAIYPEYGVNIPWTEETDTKGEKRPVKLTRKEFFGEEDPTRFGGGALLTRGIQDPLYKLIPGYGGQQMARTAQGIKAVSQGRSESKGGGVQYPIEKNLINYLQGATFGKHSLPEAQEYFDRDTTPLGEKQTERFKSLPTDRAKEYYEGVMAKRGRGEGTTAGVPMEELSGFEKVQQLADTKNYRGLENHLLKMKSDDFENYKKKAVEDYKDDPATQNLFKKVQEFKDGESRFDYELTRARHAGSKEKGYGEFTQKTQEYVQFLDKYLQRADLDTSITLQKKKINALGGTSMNPGLIIKTKSPEHLEQFAKEADKLMALYEQKLNDPNISEKDKYEVLSNIESLQRMAQDMATRVAKAGKGKGGRGRKGKKVPTLTSLVQKMTKVNAKALTKPTAPNPLANIVKLPMRSSGATGGGLRRFKAKRAKYMY